MRYSEWSSVVEYVANNLAKEIEIGEYATGDRFLTEREICEKFKVGRSSAREALRILEAMGRINIVRGKGAYVNIGTGPSEDQIKEWYHENSSLVHEIIEARAMMEPSVVSLLAGRITEAQLNELTDICDALDTAYLEKNTLNVVALDEKYHITLIDFLGNSVLSDFNATLQKRSSYYRAQTYTIPRFFSLAQDGHRAILELLRNGDADGAAMELHGHIVNAVDYFEEVSK